MAKRNRKGVKESGAIRTRPATDAYRDGWARIFAGDQSDKQQTASDEQAEKGQANGKRQ